MGRPARYLAAALLLMASIPWSHDTVVAAQEGNDEVVDFITFDGAVYLSLGYLDKDIAASGIVPLATERVGPAVGQVASNWVDPAALAAEPNEPCAWQITDGTAPRLSPGDTIYAIRAYATTFRLAVRQDETFAIYQVWCNDRAKVGADLFDIYERVERISVTGDASESSGWAVIDDADTIADLVGMLLEGAVIPAEQTSTEPVTHQLVIHLDDGTAFRASAAAGELLWGLGAVEVPARFTETLDRAWQQRVAGAA